MKKLIYLALLFSLTGLLTAQKMKPIKGNENIITTSRLTPEYDKININGSFDIKLIAGKEGNISIKGEENIIPLLKTVVKNGVLEIKMEKNTKIKSSLEITVPFTKIDQLTFSGSGNLHNNDKINNDTFNFIMSGSGNVTFTGNFTSLKIVKSGSGNLSVKGKTTNLDITASGSGNANLFDLNSKNIVTILSGSGNINVYSSKSIQAKTSGSGCVFYKGNPENVDKKSVGSGGVFAK